MPQPRRYILRHNAVELFFTTGDSVFLAFPTKRVRRRAVKQVWTSC